MSHDSRGALLQKGDRVLIEGQLVDDPQPDNGYCNCRVKIITPEQREKPPMDGDTLSAINTRMLTKVGAAILVALSLCLAAAAQEPKPADLVGRVEVDQAEILRRGPRVVVSGEGPREAGELMFTMAMAPPPLDSSMWQLTVWGKSNDAATLGVVKAFENDPNLACFVATPPGDGKLAWAHFQVFQADDPLQKWRFDAFQIPLTGPFPIVTIQPPRDGSWGGIVDGKDAKGNKTKQAVVIDRVPANELGQPADLRRRVSRSVNLWTEKLAASGFVPPAKTVQAFKDAEDVLLARSNSHGQKAFPWGPTQPPASPAVNPQWPPGGPPADAQPQPLTLEQVQKAAPDADAKFWIEELEKKYTDPQKVTFDWMLKKTQQPATPPPTPSSNLGWLAMILTLLGGGSLTGLGVLLATAWRNMRKAAGQTLLIPSDASFNELMTLLQNLGHKPIPVAPGTTPMATSVSPASALAIPR